jgi:hypothetical protein
MQAGGGGAISPAGGHDLAPDRPRMSRPFFNGDISSFVNEKERGPKGQERVHRLSPLLSPSWTLR